jgi:DnaJ like chaperone protein
MAKADGRVKPAEVAAFRQVFQIAPEDEAAAARVFNLARQDVAGFDVYAGRIARMFRRQPRILEDILEGLFHIAVADGSYHEGEEAFLRRVAEIFGVSETAFGCVEARMVADARDPWQVLGLPRDADVATAKTRWRRLVRENHPDRMFARGLPPESVQLANARLAAINAAWEEISARSATAEAVG